MNGKKSMGKLFQYLYPFLAFLTYVVSFAVVFNTFDLALDAACYNIILSLPFFGLALILTRKYHAAAILTGLVAFALFYADQYVFASRLTHIRFSDLGLISQAARVANRYSLPWNMEITRRMLIVFVLCAFLLFIYRYYQLKLSRKPAFFVGLGIFAASAAIVLSGFIPSGGEGFDFSSEAEQKGLLYSWYCQAKESRLEEPDGYSKQAAEKKLAEYAAVSGNSDVNVLVIMNESLTDYTLIGKPRFDDPLPFIHSLVESGEAFEGKLAVSVFGGGTATTEYEFLTGNAAAFLPTGASPYLQYVDRKTDNLTSELKDTGYDAVAIHPYYSEEWNRAQVYKFFGFDRFISGADFGTGVESHGKSATAKVPDNQISFGDGPLYVRGLISDQTGYERVLEESTNHSFVFNVTMQNHGGYGYRGDDFKNIEYVTEEERTEWTGKRNLYGMLYEVNSDDVESEVHDVNQYLTCSALSDQAFEYLINELKKSGNKTIVLMFGDHQPGLLIPEHFVDVEENIDLDYTVPYILWANYDITFDAPTYTSPNYLSAILKKNAGLPLTAWDQFRLEMMEKYPVITANFILDKDGNAVGKNGLEDYEIVQYMRMFE